MIEVQNTIKGDFKNTKIELEPAVANNSKMDLELHCLPSTSQQKQCAVRIRNAHKRYGSKTNSIVVLDGLNMSVPKGEIYALLGASGCGKTTLLNCIVGRKRLDYGDILVLEEAPGSKGSCIPGPRCGYMPQETALYGEFTVRETLVFFGWIAGMTTKKIQERSEFLLKLLMVSNADQKVKTLSGGEQRRLSLASALLHEPELLLLDEPTVGLDPVLRDNIWNHFLDITRDGLTTVIITTHYIDETRRAHRIALMREGYFLAEEWPGKLLKQYGFETLEEVFFKLSNIQDLEKSQFPTVNQAVIGFITDSAIVDQSETSIIAPCADVSEEIAGTITKENSHKGFPSISSSDGDVNIISLTKTLNDARFSNKNGYFNRTHMKALFWKNCLWMIRNWPMMFFLLILPFIQCSIFCVCFGNNPVDLPIGFVNYETNNLMNCEEKLTCNSSQLSCYYLKYFQNRGIILIPYDSEDEARESVLKAETYASIVLKNNYSAALYARIQDWQYSANSDIESSEIDVFRDVSSKLVANYLKAVLYDTFKSFLRDYMASCEMESKWLASPISFEYPGYGTKYPSFTDFAVPGILLTIVFLVSASLTTAVMLAERNEGLLERILIIGISKIELLASHAICQFVIIILQSLITLICLFVVFNITIKGSFLLVTALTLLTGLCGMCFGLAVSSVCNSEKMAFYTLVGIPLPLVTLSGILWPIEGMHGFLKPFAFASPFTQASESLRSILQRGWGFSSEVVYTGFVSVSIWTIIFLIASILFLKFKT